MLADFFPLALLWNVFLSLRWFTETVGLSLSNRNHWITLENSTENLSKCLQASQAGMQIKISHILKFSLLKFNQNSCVYFGRHWRSSTARLIFCDRSSTLITSWRVEERLQNVSLKHHKRAKNTHKNFD